MKSKSIVLMLVILSALTLAASNETPVVSVYPSVPAPDGPFLKYGPRVDMLIFSVAGGVVAEIGDFEAGLIDIMDWAAPGEKWDAWFADPKITMGDYGEFAPIYLALNNMRWPFGHGNQPPESPWTYPSNYWTGSGHDADKLPPSLGGTADMVYVDLDGSCQRCLDARQFRRGLAYLVDRANQIAYMQAAGTELNRTLFWPAMREGWENPSAPQYLYDRATAAATFEAGGFKDWDNDGDMEYSLTRTLAGKEELPTLVFYTRVDDDHRTHLGQIISEDMNLLGIPHNLYIATYGTVAQQVWASYDYDIYIEYWPWNPLPDFYAEWFMSRKDIYPSPWGDNEHRYHNREFDLAAEKFMNGTTPGVAYWCDEMQYIIHRDAVAIPVYSYAGYNARRTYYGNFPGETKYKDKLWADMCCSPGDAFHTYSGAWTQLNAHPQGYEKGGKLRIGLNLNPDLIDPMDSIYWYEGIVLNQIYEGLEKFNPWDLSQFEPWLCLDSEVGTWEHPEEGTCSAVKFTLVPGVLWQDGVPMTWQDVNFSCWFVRETKSVSYAYMKDFEECVNYTDIVDLDHDGTPDTEVEVVEIRFNTLSWLAEYWASGVYIIPEHIWSDQYQRYCPRHGVLEWGPGVSGSGAYNPEEHDAVIGTGPFRFYKDNVVGRVNRYGLEYIYLEPNPLYFLKYVWPDVCSGTHQQGVSDNWVDIEDFMEVVNNLFERENDDGSWTNTWGEYCDVNKDMKTGVGDLMEIGVHRYMPWLLDWYKWSPGFPPP